MISARRRGLLALPLLLLATACSAPMVSYETRNTSDGSEDAINPGYVASSVSLNYLALPKIRAMQAMHYVGGKNDSKEKLRIPAIRDAALAYGIPAGLSWATQQITQRLNQRADTLSTVFNFQNLAIRGPAGQLVLPPVISEMDSTYETSDGQQTVRIADKTYQIVKKATFTLNAPIWQSYLLRSYRKPPLPGNDNLPRNDAEQQVWAQYINEGFQEGQKQALAILRQDVAVLKRDFSGMVLYRQLLNEGKVTAPVVAETSLGITGNGNAARYNDRQLTISGQSRLNVDSPSDMHAGVSTLDATQASTPDEESPASVSDADVHAPADTPNP